MKWWRRFAGLALPRSLVLAVLLSLAGVACSVISPPAPHASKAEPSPEADRTSCDEIYGTAFRSQAERDWFTQNCSDWPLVKVPQDNPPLVGQAAPGPEPPQCAQMRGKPYQSEEQRQWFLANCLGSLPAAPPPPDAFAQGGPDRTNCDEIRGTPYRSQAERDWYLQNCAGASGQAQAGATDGTIIITVPQAQPVVVVPSGQQVAPAPQRQAPGPGRGNGFGRNR